jgi:hypothetical protein
MKRSLVKSLFLLFLAVNAVAQSDWKTKDFDKWDKTDVETILNKSEWSKSQEVRLQYETSQNVAAGSFTPATLPTGIAGNGTGRGDVNTVNQGNIQPSVNFIFTLRLRSSLAVRLALIRKNQLETSVEKLSNEERELFNKRQRGLYECPACAENYVLTLSSKSSENKNFDAVFTSFNNARFDDIKRYIYLLNDKGEKRELVNFVAPKVPGDEAIFFFRRFDDKGNLLFTKDSKYMIFNVTKNEVNTITNFKIEIPPIYVVDHVDF